MQTTSKLTFEEMSEREKERKHKGVTVQMLEKSSHFNKGPHP